MPKNPSKVMKNNFTNSGRTTVMSTLAKVANKYRNVKQNSQSFITAVVNKEQSKNENRHGSASKASDSNHLKSFLSKFTRNIPKQIKEEKSSDTVIKDSTNSKIT